MIVMDFMVVVYCIYVLLHITYQPILYFMYFIKFLGYILANATYSSGKPVAIQKKFYKSANADMYL